MKKVMLKTTLIFVGVFLIVFLLWPASREAWVYTGDCELIKANEIRQPSGNCESVKEHQGYAIGGGFGFLRTVYDDYVISGEDLYAQRDYHPFEINADNTDDIIYFYLYHALCGAFVAAGITCGIVYWRSSPKRRHS